MAKNSHAPEIVTHITSEHAKPEIFETKKSPKTDGDGKGGVNVGGKCKFDVHK